MVVSVFKQKNTAPRLGLLPAWKIPPLHGLGTRCFTSSSNPSWDVKACFLMFKGAFFVVSRRDNDMTCSLVNLGFREPRRWGTIAKKPDITWML